MSKELVMFGSPQDNMDPGEDANHGLKGPVEMLVGCMNQNTKHFQTQRPNGIFGLYYVSNSRLYLISNPLST